MAPITDSVEIGRSPEDVFAYARSSETVELDFAAYGIGQLLRPLALMQARKSVTKGRQRLKDKLESGAA